MTERLIEDKAAIIIGAARGAGRFHALESVWHSARVVMDDRGEALEGFGAYTLPAEENQALGSTVVGELDALARKLLEFSYRSLRLPVNDQKTV